MSPVSPPFYKSLELCCILSWDADTKVLNLKIKGVPKKKEPPIKDDIPEFFAVVCNERINKNCILLHIIAAWYIFE